MPMTSTNILGSEAIKELAAMKRSLESSSDDVGCFSACDPELPVPLKQNCKNAVVRQPRIIGIANVKGFVFI